MLLFLFRGLYIIKTLMQIFLTVSLVLCAVSKDNHPLIVPETLSCLLWEVPNPFLLFSSFFFLASIYPLWKIRYNSTSMINFISLFSTISSFISPLCPLNSSYLFQPFIHLYSYILLAQFSHCLVFLVSLHLWFR